jgi:hypothetical protein
MANLKSTDAVVVGMYDKYIDEYGISRKYVREYSGTSMRRLTSRISGGWHSRRCSCLAGPGFGQVLEK